MSPLEKKISISKLDEKYLIKLNNFIRVQKIKLINCDPHRTLYDLVTKDIFLGAEIMSKYTAKEMTEKMNRQNKKHVDVAEVRKTTEKEEALENKNTNLIDHMMQLQEEFNQYIEIQFEAAQDEYDALQSSSSQQSR